MATAFRLISEAESTKFTGVSLDTIRQYERFGLLQSVRKGQEVFYRENDLKAVFAVSESQAFSDLDSSPITGGDRHPDSESKSHPAPPSLSPSSPTGVPVESPNVGHPPDASVSTKNAEPSETLSAERAHLSEGFSHPQPSSETGTATKNDSQAGSPQVSEVLPNEERESNASSRTGQRVSPQPTRSVGETSEPRQLRLLSSIPNGPEDSPPQYSTSHPHNPGVFEMMESNRTLREQIEILKDERDWLRRRVEKLETRSERDQMILIAENETVKGLLHQMDKPKKSFWSFSLPWLTAPK